VPKKLDAWQEAMTAVFRELHRVLKPGGHVAFEVGEVPRRQNQDWRKPFFPAASPSAWNLSSSSSTTRNSPKPPTAGAWTTISEGTNTNRIVLFRKSQS